MIWKLHRQYAQRSLILEILPSKFYVGHNLAELTKTSGHVKGEDAADHKTVARWFKKFRSGCKYLDDQAKLGRAKNVHYYAVL